VHRKLIARLSFFFCSNARKMNILKFCNLLYQKKVGKDFGFGCLKIFKRLEIKNHLIDSSVSFRTKPVASFFRNLENFRGLQRLLS
jgi:hypothetical protein